MADEEREHSFEDDDRDDELDASDDSADLESLDIPPSFFPAFEDVEVEEDGDFSRDPVQVQVENVFATQTADSHQRFLLLSDGRRRLPINIGAFEAASISFALNEKTPDRPQTHDLIKSVVERLGAAIVKILIDDIWGDTYYAKIFLRHNGEEIIIDSRPSDAIAIAIRAGAQIFVADGILERHGR